MHPSLSLSPFILVFLQKRLDEEVAQLMIDIRRLGSEPGSPQVKFGELFDDDNVQQYYEALVGTLKSAKKRGMISFQGQMLLKGMHDDVVISITKEQLAKLDNNCENSNSGKDSSGSEPSMTDEVPIMA
jgi:Costars